MGLFDEQIEQVAAFLEANRTFAKEYEPQNYRNWPQKNCMILTENTACELGHSQSGSLSLILLGDRCMPQLAPITLIGPDLPDIKKKAISFAQIVMVQGHCEDEYEGFCDLKDAVHEIRLDGLMLRALPSRQSIWYRLSLEAATNGLSIGHLGSELRQSLMNLEFIEDVKIVFLTDDRVRIAQLEPVANSAARIVSALRKMGEEMNFECESCEYWDVCASVSELKRIRDKLMKERAK